MLVFAIFTIISGMAQQRDDANIPPFENSETDVADHQTSFDDNSRQILYPKREFRCAWVATVENIDYPSNTGLSVANLKTEFVSILNKLKAAGINAVFVQIRPSCDAFYNSPYEPWSEWLSGTQGVAPSGGFDPLTFMIDEAHKRGIEFHAWLNPYRAVVSIGNSSVASNHVSVLHPSWCVTYNSLKLLNPGLPEVRDYVKMIVADIVTRYSVDGIHFDDYFYPYPANGTAFNDNATFAAYPRGFTNKDNWRRDNVNLLIGMINDTIKAIKPYVKFGVGPFGIWKSGVPSGITGLSSYDEIYCDPIAWLNSQTVDYVAPQLYWKIGGSQDFNTLVDWWGTQANSKSRHCYAGIASYLMDPNNSNWTVNNVLNEISSTRVINYKAQGESFFSSSSITTNSKSFADSLKLSFNKYKCLIPTMPWLDSIPPLQPDSVSYTTTSNGIALHWHKPTPASDNDTAKYFVVYRSTDGNVVDITDPKDILYISPTSIITFVDTIAVNSFPGVAYAITSCDKLHNESDVVYINVTVTPPANDNCITAQSLTASVACSPVVGNLSNSVASGIPKPSCDGFSSPALLDVWYKFTATSVVHTVKVLPDGDFDPVLSLYTGCSNSELGCADNGGPGVSDSLVATNLNIGSTYYVRLYDYGSLPPDTTTFGICVTEPFVASGINNTPVQLFNVYPNPSDGSVLYGNVSAELLSVRIHDVLGRLVFEKQVVIQNGKFSITFPEKLKSGMYLFTATNADLRYTQRISIE
jgi:uncharacterized lipoprotein YddW (UPF0748 family)